MEFPLLPTRAIGLHIGNADGEAAHHHRAGGRSGTAENGKADADAGGIEAGGAAGGAQLDLRWDALRRCFALPRMGDGTGRKSMALGIDEGGGHDRLRVAQRDLDHIRREESALQRRRRAAELDGLLGGAGGGQQKRGQKEESSGA